MVPFEVINLFANYLGFRRMWSTAGVNMMEIMTLPWYYTVLQKHTTSRFSGINVYSWKYIYSICFYALEVSYNPKDESLAY